MTPYQAYAAWYAGTSTGSAAVHVDTRGPNGGGDGSVPASTHCLLVQACCIDVFGTAPAAPAAGAGAAGVAGATHLLRGSQFAAL
jgi:hypothetical protein